MEYILTATEDNAVLGIEKARLIRLGYDETGRQNSMTLYVFPKPGKYPEAYNRSLIEVFNNEFGISKVKATQIAYYTLDPKSWGDGSISSLNKSATQYATMGMLYTKIEENHRFSVIRDFGKKTMQRFEEIIAEFGKLHGPYAKTADIPGRIEIFHTDLCEHILSAYEVEEIED